MVIGFPKSTFVSREFFYFQILEGGHSLSGTVLGEIIRFMAQNGRISSFQ